MLYALFVCTLFTHHPEMTKCNPAAPLVIFHTLDECERERLKVYRAYTGRDPNTPVAPFDPSNPLKPLPPVIPDVLCMEKPDWQPALSPR
jgi:hypothetical protein